MDNGLGDKKVYMPRHSGDITSDTRKAVIQDISVNFEFARQRIANISEH